MKAALRRLTHPRDTRTIAARLEATGNSELEARLYAYGAALPNISDEQRERMQDRWRANATGNPAFVPLDDCTCIPNSSLTHHSTCPCYVAFTPLPLQPAFPRRQRFATFRMLYVRGAIAIACGFAYAWAMWAVVRTAQDLGAF